MNVSTKAIKGAIEMVRLSNEATILVNEAEDEVTILLEALAKAESERDRLRQEVENRYSHVEVAMWLGAYRRKYREKTLTEWVREYRKLGEREEKCRAMTLTAKSCLNCANRPYRLARAYPCNNCDDERMMFNEWLPSIEQAEAMEKEEGEI